MASEGQHTQKGAAAPRSLEVIRHDLRVASKDGNNKARVDELLDEMSDAADQATHLKGGKRGN